MPKILIKTAPGDYKENPDDPNEIKYILPPELDKSVVDFLLYLWYSPTFINSYFNGWLRPVNNNEIELPREIITNSGQKYAIVLCYDHRIYSSQVQQVVKKIQEKLPNFTLIHCNSQAIPCLGPYEHVFFLMLGQPTSENIFQSLIQGPSDLDIFIFNAPVNLPDLKKLAHQQGSTEHSSLLSKCRFYIHKDELNHNIPYYEVNYWCFTVEPPNVILDNLIQDLIQDINNLIGT